MKKAVQLAGAAVFVLSLAACNTIKGVGQDTEKVGQQIEETAEEAGAE